MEVQVIRSPRRRRTVEAREVDGVIRVSIPSTMSAVEERRHVEKLVGRLQRRSNTSNVPLDQRSRALARRLGLPLPNTIRWVENQNTRWGSCSVAERSIRISSRLVRYPLWVLDYVIVHELAHLAVPGHGPAFWALVNRYERTERARGFLLAKSVGGDGEDWVDCPAVADGSA